MCDTVSKYLQGYKLLQLMKLRPKVRTYKNIIDMYYFHSLSTILSGVTYSLVQLSQSTYYIFMTMTLLNAHWTSYWLTE